MTKKEFLDTWFERVWKDEDPAAIYEYYAGDGTAHGLGEAHRTGPDEFAAFHRKLLKLVGEVRVRYSHIMEEGDWISYMGALRWSIGERGGRFRWRGARCARSSTTRSSSPTTPGTFWGCSARSG